MNIARLSWTWFSCCLPGRIYLVVCFEIHMAWVPLVVKNGDSMGIHKGNKGGDRPMKGVAMANKKNTQEWVQSCLQKSVGHIGFEAYLKYPMFIDV